MVATTLRRGSKMTSFGGWKSLARRQVVWCMHSEQRPEFNAGYPLREESKKVSLIGKRMSDTCVSLLAEMRGT
jgi:hypothetical protein